MANLNNLIQQFRNELGADFISTGVIGMKDGLSIAWRVMTIRISHDDN